jgi:L-ascorbate metabolism protein UlaG (beta-lactamase superfamily)
MFRVSRVTTVIAALTVPIVCSAADRFTAAGGDITITPLSHASVRVDFAGRTIYVDPWRADTLTDAPRANLIIVTDADAGGHHLDPAALARLRATGATVVIPQSGKQKVPEGVVMANGATQSFGDVTVEAIPAYDLVPGEPFHARGAANGYLVTLGGKRLYFAGVTECVPEMKALKNIDIAFMPMNLPNGRMTPDAVASCVRSFRPRVVYPYHYDQGYTARLAGRGDPAGATVAAGTVRTLADSLKGVADVREGNWYPAR